MIRKLERLRSENLERLIREAGTLKELARRADTSSSYLSQVRHRMRTPSGRHRKVTDELAGVLERAMGKPDGWMDESHGPQAFLAGDTIEPAAHGEVPTHLRPLVSWVQAGHWSENLASPVPEDEVEWLPCPVRCSLRTFVLKVRGISMEPDFSEGDLIYVDPEVEPANGRHVVVRKEGTDEATFKQFVNEDDRMFLRALNPDWPDRIVEIDKAVTVCGVVVFKGKVV
ncbi:MAG: XRE family transcriptional regulator [Gammaproteobacteria bacterium]|nr:XRE family transcriptional regulator [Gammaproteobacteria bacterium]MDE0411545.1 XRE family transcriptional regulator [Gammaproteobacteria bacterium]